MQTEPTPTTVPEFDYIWRKWLNNLWEQVRVLQTTPSVQTLNISNIPTSATGLSSGDVWSNAGVLTIVA